MLVVGAGFRATWFYFLFSKLDGNQGGRRGRFAWARTQDPRFDGGELRVSGEGEARESEREGESWGECDEAAVERLIHHWLSYVMLGHRRWPASPVCQTLEREHQPGTITGLHDRSNPDHQFLRFI